MVHMKKTKNMYFPLLVVVIGVIITISSLSDIWNQRIHQNEMLQIVKKEFLLAYQSFLELIGDI